MSWCTQNMYRPTDVQTCTGQYVHVHQRTGLYRPVRTRTYGYIRVHAVPYPFKKKCKQVSNPQSSAYFAQWYPCATGVQTSMPVKIRCDVKVYIICFCQTPCPCTWRLMTDPPAMTSPGPARAWTRISWRPSCAWKQGLERAMCGRQTEDLIRKRQWLDSCPVFSSTQHWAIPSQRPTHLNAAESLGYMRHSGPTTGTWTGIVIVAISTCGPGRSAMWVLSQTAGLVSKTISAGRLNFRRRRLEILTAFAWAGSSFLKPLEHSKR